MTLRGRLERLERRKSAGGLPCPACGWGGPMLILNEYVDAAGRVVRVEDSEGNPLPDFPDIPSCDLCNSQNKYVACRRPVGGAGSWGASS